MKKLNKLEIRKGYVLNILRQNNFINEEIINTIERTRTAHEVNKFILSLPKNIIKKFDTPIEDKYSITTKNSIYAISTPMGRKRG